MSRGTPVEKKPIKDLLAEKDAFLTTSDRLYEYFLRHTKGFITVALALAALVAAFVAYGKYQASAEEKARMAYESALESLVSDPDQALASLEAVRADFAGREAARMAGYTLVSFYSARGDNGKALTVSEELMRTLPPAEAALKPALLGNLAGLYEAEKKYDEAAAAYDSLLSLGVAQPALRRDSLMALGRINTVRGKTEEAAISYQAVINEFPNDLKAYMANSLLAALKGEALAFPGSLPVESEENAAKEETSQQN